MRLAPLALLLALLPLPARAHGARDAHDDREEVRTGILRAIGWDIAAGASPESAAGSFQPVCGDPRDLRQPLPDARAPWRAGYPHFVRSEPLQCHPSPVDGPR